MGVSKTSDHIQIKIQMPNPSKEPPISSKALTQDLKDVVDFCAFKIMIEKQNWDMGASKMSDHIQIKIKIPSPTQESPESSKAPNEDFMDMDVLCTFKIKKESQNSDYGYIKDQ